MYSLRQFLVLFIAYHGAYVEALPTQGVQAAPPSEFTANPSIGGGGSQYKDSAHFRVYGVSSSTADQTLKVMEAAHQCFVETLGWRTPGLSYKSDSGAYYKENIYRVDASSMPGAAAQTWTDATAGLAYLKVVEQYMTTPGVIVHEYGHAMTYSEKNWIDQTRTGAWWETIANFIADTYVSTPVCETAKAKSSLPSGDSLIELKEVIGNSYKVIVDGTSGSGNYYQAWPFLSYITNNPDNYSGLGSQALLNMIRKYKLNSNETPLHSLERLLSGVTIQQVVGRYWARMAYVDIGHSKAQQMFSSQKKSLTYANLDSNGNGKYTVKSARQPRYMGSNIIPLKATSSTINASVTASGAFTASLVVKASSGTFRYVDLVNGSGSVTIASGEEASLVVANTPSLVQYDPFSIPADVNKGLSYSIQISGATA
ncbi:uncharacterized protein BDR25DRAFT_303120 [Lindgomyces ingoldianus]|uniref:Uncharacterized protein n=1 Tax=Lindgomyces ingoldianus TaxID=673940 RepID=A0ACB6QXL0_9PLEO|nr:uncharacterized protein BDR25DRAFT_303120 [Lindgomyces ingoldianus]KAF2471615.1 hypothetical protein BDR25DRAFT_303120 [Lindgomyces ingoldianus]